MRLNLFRLCSEGCTGFLFRDIAANGVVCENGRYTFEIFLLREKQNHFPSTSAMHYFLLVKHTKAPI